MLIQWWTDFVCRWPHMHRCNNGMDRGRLVPQLLCWRTNNVLVPQLLGRRFQKARNFTASSHQNAGFSIRVFKNFLGVIPPVPHSWRGWPFPAPNTHAGLWPGAGCKCPVLGPKPWSPNFSVVVAPLHTWSLNMLWGPDIQLAWFPTIIPRCSQMICTE